MINYAQVSDNQVIGIYEYASKVLDDSLIEVNSDSLVKRGYLYNSDSGEFSAPVENSVSEISVVVTSVKVDGIEQTDDYRLKLPVNAVTELVIELQDSDGNILAVDEHFALPLTGVIGQAGRTIGADFNQGIAQLVIAWPQSGEWQISEESINMYIDSTQLNYVFYCVQVIIVVN